MKTNDEPNREVKTTSTVFGIVEFIEKATGATLSEISEQMEMSPSTIHDHLSTLLYKGYVAKKDDSYRLGLKFFTLGMKAKNAHPLSQAIYPTVTELARQTDKTTWILVEDHGEVICFEKVNGKFKIKTRGGVGVRLPMYDNAGGKAILAYLPPDRVDEILDQHGFVAQTPNTITDRERLREELQRVRETGVAYNDGENIVGLRAIASPILMEDEIIGAIAISDMSHRMNGAVYREELPKLIKGCANEIALALQYSE